MSQHPDTQRGTGKTEQQHQFLTFTVGHEEYGVDIMTVREIKGWTEITRLPNSPHYLRGVMNLRGLIIPIFDLRARFSHDLTAANSKHVIIILAVGERNIGILVDSVFDIIDVQSSDIKPPPEIEMQAEATAVNGLISLEDRMVVLLNISRLFDVTIPHLETSTPNETAGQIQS